MRLAQLARKIAVKPAEIVTFLQNQNSPVEDSSNAKITDSQVELVLKHFAPEQLDGLQPEVSPPIEIQEKEKTVEIPEIEIETQPRVTPQEDAAPLDNVEPEVIKPPKVELPGLKVVGKIELPEPKKKENEKLEGTEGESAEEAIEPRRAPRPENRKKIRTSDQERRPRKNPIALQREREEREALRRRQEEKKKEKELRTQRYLKKVSKVTQPIKPVKMRKHEDEYEVFVEEKAKPKSLVGKIIGWFVSD